ncbi:OmpP1/FadL family transporter [Pontiella sp.]|uniref:OmpP1/FadL family transporter n=1 Tax=Pontiella sp. TaxID=2837462 RepID=UPI0035663454
MKKNYKVITGCVFVGLAAISQYAQADGYRNPPSTAEGIAKSGANSVWVDDASAISYNPANLAFQTNQSFVLSTTFARTENEYTVPTVGTFESSGDWNMLPNLFYSQPIGENGWALGLGITTPFGQGLSWEYDDFETLTGYSNMVPYEANVALIDLNPTIAFKVHEDVSIGIGVDFYLSQLGLTAVQGITTNVDFGPPLGMVLIQDNFKVEAESYGWGIGANAGMSWDIADGHRFSATYRSAFEIEYSGKVKVDGQPDSDFDTAVKYPNIVSLGYGVQLTERVQIETMVEWLNWSNNESQIIEIEGQPPTELVNNWDDTFTFGLGGSWQALDTLAVRAGYAYIPSPIPDDTITHLLPDADRHAISFGLGYTRGAHTVDLAYTFSIYEDRSAPADGAGPGLYDIDSNLVGLTYSASF